VQEYITTALENEAEKVSEFEKYFFETTDKIQELFVNVNVDDFNDATETGGVMTSVANMGFGAGGIYMGFKQAGWKGALLGGATAFGGWLGVALVTSMLAIPFTLPFIAIGAVVGTFTSKFALKRFFPTDKTRAFRDKFTESILDELENMRTQNDFGETVKTQIEDAFDSLKEKLKTETEHVLGDTQNQLTSLKVELSKATVLDEKEKEELNHMLSAVDEICTRADELGRQLTTVLSKL
jgi:hypothetical protein